MVVAAGEFGVRRQRGERIQHDLRPLTVLAAWAAGFAIYLAAVIAWNSYDGCLSLVFLPLCGAVVSAAGVAVAAAVGWVARRTRLGLTRREGQVAAVAVALAGTGLMVLGSSVGLTHGYADPETGERFEAVHPAAAAGGYLMVLVAIANWPLQRTYADAEPLAAPGGDEGA